MKVPRRSWADNTARTTQPVDFNSLMTGLENKIFGRLPDATWVYPGTEPILRSPPSRHTGEEWRERGW